MRATLHVAILGVLAMSSCARRLELPRGASWDERSGVFRWWAGEVRLPAGFTYQVGVSDTFEGHFTSPDGKLVVRHDIGGYAGVWAEEKNALFFEERIVEGSRVWMARRNWPDGSGGTTTLVAVTFPDQGCANFFVMSSKVEDAAPIDLIARTFRPKSKTEAGPLCTQRDRG